MFRNKGKQHHRVDPVEVYCRVRPLTDKENDENCLKILDESNLMLQIPEVSWIGLKCFVFLSWVCLIDLIYLKVLGLVQIGPDQTTDLLVHSNLWWADDAEASIWADRFAARARRAQWKEWTFVYVWSHGKREDVHDERKSIRVWAVAAIAGHPIQFHIVSTS